MKTYQLTIGDQQRNLPIVPISDDTAIASFVLLGDDAMSYTAAKLLLPKLPAAEQSSPLIGHSQVGEGIHAASPGNAR